ncbi:hypothetical protein CICLE_v10003322mg [Citrus x clementina]|uniref:Cytochrome P450 n=1 Tax=Citrus clementina TaxID=85681 RepID=V4TD76_CITCL|nr:hypothetical protein CICLE_v10003322mg [Citrus x clementina]
MWSICIIPLVIIIAMTYCSHKWRNPTSKGIRLPPGSMGLPFIGETIQFFIPSKSLDLHSFLKSRINKYGPLFQTSLVGRSVVVSSDPDISHFILQQEGKLVELWYMDSFVRLVGLSGSVKDGSCIIAGSIHKRLKKLVFDQFGPQNLKAKLLPQLQEMINQALLNWTTQNFVELKHACTVMIINFTMSHLFGYDPVKYGEIQAEEFTHFFEGLMSLPLNIPGTTYHRCLKKQKSTLKIMKMMIEDRQAKLPEERTRGDFLELIVEDMKNNNLLTSDLISYMMFGLLLATFETISTTLTLTVMLLTQHPLVVQELERENKEIVQKRSVETAMTWEEFRSLTFTKQVINEVLRMGNFVPGFLRRAIKDIQIKEYTIPEGWTIMVVPSAIHLNPETYTDPFVFNPWRWKHLAENNVTSAKNFIPFGEGIRLCPGAEFSKVLLTLFLNVLATKYSWSQVKPGEIIRAPTMGFGKGYYIKVAEKSI